MEEVRVAYWLYYIFVRSSQPSLAHRLETAAVESQLGPAFSRNRTMPRIPQGCPASASSYE